MFGIRNFFRDESGNFALTLAIAALPLMFAAGAALDYSERSREETRLRNTLDAAILAVGIDFPSMAKTQVQKTIREYLKSNLTAAEYDQIKNLKITPDVKGRYLTATATAQMETSIMMLAGIEKLEYQAVAQIKAASGGAEIAFVLDNTGSMTVDGKLDALKNAATNFTDAIMRKSSGGDIKIGIVPFSNHVNVGLSNRSASWIDVPADSTREEANYCYMTSDVVSETNCRTVTHTTSEGISYQTQQCDRTYGVPYEVCGPRTVTETWHGCVGSRIEPYNLEDRGYGARRVPGLMNITCGAEILPLTNEKSTVLDKITAMHGSGDTYIPSGLTWGMRMLSSQAPYTQGVTKLNAKNNDIKKYLILMTDGDNTRSAQLPGDPSHWGGDIDQANDWTAKLCDNIKAEDVSIFTITFGTLLPATRDLIRDCADSPAQYFHASTGDELNAAFEDIRGQIAALHLSQ